MPQPISVWPPYVERAQLSVTSVLSDRVEDDVRLMNELALVICLLRGRSQTTLQNRHVSVETRHVLKSPSPEGRRRRRYSVAWGGGRLRGASIRDTQAYYKAVARLRFVRNK